MNTINLINKFRPRQLKNYLWRQYFNYREITWQQRPLPDFIVIGAQKSGTSSLFNYLCQHAQIYSSPLKNEIHFFDGFGRNPKVDNYAKGTIWYRAHFPREHEMNEHRRIFDSTPLYIFHPQVAKRIFNLIPAVKIIAMLRNPTERAISHYFMTQRKGRESLNMLEAFQIEEARLDNYFDGSGKITREAVDYSYKSRGRYAEQLERYYQFFPPNQLLILSSEEFFSEYKKTLNQIFDFIGVDTGPIKELVPINAGLNKKNLNEDVREYLNDYFKPYNQVFCDLTGKNFGW